MAAAPHAPVSIATQAREQSAIAPAETAVLTPVLAYGPGAGSQGHIDAP